MTKRLKRKGFAALFAALAIAAAFTFYPFETVVVPEWRLRVLDEAGRPIKGVSLRETWSDNSVKPGDDTEDFTTDADGYAVFPKRTVRANLLSRIIRRVLTIAVPHQGEGHAIAYILVLGPFHPVTDEPYYEPGRAPAGEIVVRPTATLSP